MTNKSEVLEGEYNGKAMLIIRRDLSDRFPFQFGVIKAKLILENLDAIRAFVAKHDKKGV